MTVAIDTSCLLHLVNPHTPAPKGESGREVDRCQDRINLLLKTIGSTSERILVPTPVLSELIGRAAKDGPRYLQILDGQKAFRIANFDQLAAVEAATLLAENRAALQEEGLSRVAIKFDTMIVAIARVHRARVIYSDDNGIRRLGKRIGLDVIGIGEMPLPDADLLDALKD